MSIWTHVNGSIRVDRLPGIMGVQSRGEIMKILGKINRFEDSEWEEEGIPTGSEGSLEYEIYENPAGDHMAAFTIVIWGDLRSYEDINPIVEWFEKCLKRLGMIRGAVMEITGGIQRDDKGYYETFLRYKNKRLEIHKFYCGGVVDDRI